VLSSGEAAAHAALEHFWADYFTRKDRAPGLPPNSIEDPKEVRLLNNYFSWATWATVTDRPGKDYTYTNNWPYDPDAGNRPSTQAYVWSALSLVVLLGGLGLVLLLFGKFHFLGWGGEEPGSQAQPAGSSFGLTPSQRAASKYFAVVGLLFLLQALLGGALAIYFVIAVGVWNFIGASIFGFLINTPIISYFEIGTTLTANHGHAAMFGVFGMLGLGVLAFCLRSLQSDEAWRATERYVRLGYWGLNIGLALMILLDLFPAGVLQLRDVIARGYWHARRLDFAMAGPYHLLEWIRIAGDATFIFFGALPLGLAALTSMRRQQTSG
jgi:nitric oxide reductase large subunit